MNIPYKVIDADTQDYAEIIRETVNKSLSSSGPMALLVRKGTFKKQPKARMSLQKRYLKVQN